MEPIYVSVIRFKFDDYFELHDITIQRYDSIKMTRLNKLHAFLVRNGSSTGTFSYQTNFNLCFVNYVCYLTQKIKNRCTRSKVNQHLPIRCSAE